MKKLLFILSLVAGFVFAADDCSQAAEKVVSKLAAHNRTQVFINYSSDQAAKANTCKTAILAKNSALTVTLRPVSGTNEFKFTGK